LDNAIFTVLAGDECNVLLAYIITVPFIGVLFLPLLGAFQRPAFSPCY